MTMVEVSIIILAKNAGAEFYKTLEIIYAQNNLKGRQV